MCTGQSVYGVNAEQHVALKALTHISGRRAEGGPRGAQVHHAAAEQHRLRH